MMVATVSVGASSEIADTAIPGSAVDSHVPKNIKNIHNKQTTDE